MKWVNHEIITGVIVYAATEDVLLTCYSMAGAIFPDKVEGAPGSIGYSTWRSRHRGWSHWPLLYIAIIGLIYRTSGGWESLSDLDVIGLYICIGALLHIAEDAVCGRVPLVTPGQKVGVRLFTVGSITEYIFSIAVVLITYIIYSVFMLK